MGATSALLGFGPFYESIRAYLGYDSDKYTCGAIVVSTMFYCATASRSSDLAEALGVRLDDHHRHFFDAPQLRTRMGKIENLMSDRLT